MNGGVNDAMKTGVGNFTLIYDEKYLCKFVFKKRHYYTEIINKDPIQINYEHLIDEQQKLYISYLLNYNNYDDDTHYIWIKYTPEMLINKYNTNKSFHLLALLSSGFIDTDTRSRIFINTNELPELYKYIKNYEDEFGYSSDDFKFVDKIQNLRILNHSFLNKNITDLPDMKNLKELEKISNFANGCKSLKTIDLSGLINLKSIGDLFAFECQSLTEIKLSKNIETIGNVFAKGCQSLTTIDLSGLTNLKTIGIGFAFYCQRLTTINLSGLTNLKTIGYGFAQSCEKLTTIDLSGLTNLETIGDLFAQGCVSLTEIKLSKNIETIGRHFAKGCQLLKTIDLSGLTNLKTIDNGFAYDC
jgi:hypothetical protein